MKAKNKREEVLLSVIRELVKEKNTMEFRMKNPLPKGWIYAEDHPRIGELLEVFPNILSK